MIQMMTRIAKNNNNTNIYTFKFKKVFPITAKNVYKKK